MSQSSIALLEALTQADAVPGHETEVCAIFRGRLEGIGPLGNDRLGSVFCTKMGSADRPRVLIDSHVDEVGFIVQSITPEGHLRFLPLGGWWTHTLLAQRVRVLTRQGKVPGIIGSIPPHRLASETQGKVLEIADLFIDIGAESKEQAMEEFAVTPGCAVAPYSPFLPLKNEKRFSAKAFDNRVGVALVIETLERLGEHPNTVIGSGTVQEEVGLRGAGTVTSTVEPDLAIVLEGPYADDTPPGGDGGQCRLGGGVHVRLYDPTMIANPRLCELVIATAEANGIPHQLAVWGAGGTDAGAIHRVGRGVPTIVLGVPVRYIHSHVSVLDIDDYMAARELLLHLLLKLDHATIARMSGGLDGAMAAG